jgi:hypothetical protein
MNRLAPPTGELPLSAQLSAAFDDIGCLDNNPLFF